MCFVYAGEDAARTVGTSGEPGKKRRKRIVEVLFVGIPEIEIEVRHGG